LEESVGEQEVLEEEDGLLFIKQTVNDSGTVGDNVVEPKLFWFVVDSEVIYWSAKGRFGVGEVPIEELGTGVGDKSWLIIPTGKDILL
jgi:hypothetical protein